MPDIAHWLKSAVEAGASDLHVVSGYQPTLRIHGRLQPLEVPVPETEPLRSELLALCPDESRVELDSGKNADFALELDVDGQVRRFRVNYFVAAGRLGACYGSFESPRRALHDQNLRFLS